MRIRGQRFVASHANRVESGTVESPFDAVIVDEVQDLQPQELRFLKALSRRRIRVTHAAGRRRTARIYPGGFSLKKLGIDARGRSHILRINYRTTSKSADLPMACWPPRPMTSMTVRKPAILRVC